jgi:uncharacterized protein involved in exopolysaccharide biosynthesis
VITIVDTAKVPDARFGPKRVPMLELGVAGGGFLSILYIALATFLASISLGKKDIVGEMDDSVTNPH